MLILRYKPFYIEYKNKNKDHFACLNPNSLLKGKSLFINGGMNHYHIPDTALLPVILNALLMLRTLLVILWQVHAEPADLVRAIYFENNGKNQIIAMLNQTQQIVHLHPQNLIFGYWSFKHRVLPNALQLFGFVFALIFLFFSLAAFSVGHFQLGKMLQDALMLCLMGLGLFTIGFILPFAVPYLCWQRYKTMKTPTLAGFKPASNFRNGKMNPQNRIYHLNPVPDRFKQSAWFKM